MKSTNSKNRKPLRRIINAISYSVSGLAASWQDEQAFRQEIVLFIVLTPLALLMPITLPLKLILILSMLGVLIVELVNSSIEAVTDLITEENHPLAKKAKDCGSAAVFLSLISCLVAWSVALYTWYQASDL